MINRFKLLATTAFLGAGLAMTPAPAQIDVEGALRGAAQGALRGAARGGDVGDRVVRGAVRGAAGLDTRYPYAYSNRAFRIDNNPPLFNDNIRLNSQYDQLFYTRFGRNADRQRFRYNDGYWWYGTNDSGWVYERNGDWYLRNGQPYRGFDVRNVGSRHPNYRYYNNYWWYNTGNDWVFFNDGRWYRSDGRYYASPRSAVSLNAGPMRIDLFVGSDGRQYRYENDHWWYRDGDDWYFQRNGYWYNQQQNRRVRAVEPEMLTQFRSRIQSMRHPDRDRAADVAASVETRANAGREVNSEIEANARLDADSDAGLEAQAGLSGELPPPPANDTAQEKEVRIEKFQGELPSAPVELEASDDAETRANVEAQTRRNLGVNRRRGEARANNRTGLDSDAKIDAEVDVSDEGVDVNVKTKSKADADVEAAPEVPQAEVLNKRADSEVETKGKADIDVEAAPEVPDADVEVDVPSPTEE